MLRVKQSWDHFWFAPQDARDLGFARAIIMLGEFFYYRTLNLEAWGYVRPSFWRVIPLFEHLHWTPMSPAKMWAIGIIWKCSLLLGAIGFFTRFSCTIAFIAGLYLLGLPNNIGKVDHNEAIVLWSFFIFAIGRSGDAWSVDALIRTARARGLSSEAPRLGLKPDPEYRWPLGMLQMLMAIIFCCAGIAKLTHAGLAWATSDNLRNIFIMQQYFSTPLLGGLGMWIASHRYLCVFLAFSTLVFETSAPLALFNKWAALIILGSMFGMQIGNELLLGINFRQFMLCYAVWIPWTDLGRWLRSKLRSVRTPAATMLFDGSCGLCTRTMTLVRRLDLFQNVEILDAEQQWPNIATRFPSLRQDSCLQTMHVIQRDGSITTGFYAYRTLAWLIPMAWLTLPLLYLPGMSWAGNRIYEKVAANRYRNGCSIGLTA